MDRTTIYRRYDNNQIEINLLYKNTTDTLPDDFNVTEHYDNAKTQINEDITSTGTILEEDKENFIDEIFENTENEFITLNINDSIKRPITLYSWKNIITAIASLVSPIINAPIDAMVMSTFSSRPSPLIMLLNAFKIIS